ncbi:death on curing protein [Parageobacillus thermantarcticus]|uniref:Death on curing protein n=1 Tax=Parageobacillus thermantarcticus TaxID=186116 RepID=A0A1I0TWF9_9BACL|nr:type II toxin-antitoxin system death-on-curing family toxin [Parageobacillus thermantarcticus]SFA56007.1 death on curing protein [Parageobacillus thermantarcticus]
MVYYLTAEEIIFIHYTIMEMYGDAEQAGIQFPDKFAWMLERPKTKLFGEEQFPSIIEKACCYYHSIATGHIFHNGNKRTALAVFVTFLDLNGYEFTMTNKEAEDFTVYLAEDAKFRGNDCIHHLVRELKDYIRPIQKQKE